MGLRVAAVVCGIAAMGAPSPVFAHDSLERYVQHAATLRVTAENIDVTLEISFNAHDSLDERQVMDADRDSVLSEEEKKGYLRQVVAEAERQVRLRVDHEDVRLVPLYDPELDFFDSGDMEEHPHVLRIFLFARTPATLKKGSDIRLEDRLWENKPALLQARVKSGSGIDLVANQDGTALRLGNEDGSRRLLRWTCTAFRREPAANDRRAQGEGP